MKDTWTKPKGGGFESGRQGTGGVGGGRGEVKMETNVLEQQ